MFADNMISVKNTPELLAVLENIKIAYNDVVVANPKFTVTTVSSIVKR